LLENGCVNTSIARQREPQYIVPTAMKKHTTTEEPWRRCFLCSPCQGHVRGPRDRPEVCSELTAEGGSWQLKASDSQEAAVDEFSLGLTAEGSTSGSQQAEVGVEMVTSMRGREPRSRGTPATGSRYQAT
jgi:hypothetical protein